MKPKVYLAGPMNKLSYEEAGAWRERAQRELAEVGIAAYSPLRDKEFLAGTVIDSKVDTQVPHPLTTSRGIVTRDHRDCTTADVVLVNFSGFDGISLGSIVEMGWAWDRRIPVVVVCPPNNPHITHPFGAELFNFRVDTLDEGLLLVKSLLLAEGA